MSNQSKPASGKKSTFAINPLLPKSPEQKERISRELLEIRKKHGATQRYVAEKFMNDPKPIRIDKA